MSTSASLPWLATSLVGPRVVVRPLASVDLPGLLAVNGDDAVTHFLPYASWQSLADAEAWFRRISALQEGGTLRQFVIVERASTAVIGACVIFRFDVASRRAELGYVLGREYQGQGFARETLALLLTYAFAPMPEGMGLRRLEAEVAPDNKPSSRLLEKLGFTREGHARERWLVKGMARDVLIYGMLDREWPEAVKVGTNDALLSASTRA